MICDEIKAYLRNKGITQSYISRKTGIPENTLSDMLNGKRRITAEEYLKICIALDVQPNRFASSVS